MNRKEIKIMNRLEYEMKQPMSPLQRLYNIEKILFPDIEKIKNNINNFEKALIEIYSEKKGQNNENKV